MYETDPKTRALQAIYENMNDDPTCGGSRPDPLAIPEVANESEVSSRDMDRAVLDDEPRNRLVMKSLDMLRNDINCPRNREHINTILDWVQDILEPDDVMLQRTDTQPIEQPPI